MAKERRRMEDWEISLLNEQRCLMSIGETWHICAQVTDANLKELGSYLDPNLLECIKQVHAQLSGLLYYGADLNLSRRKSVAVESIAAALKEVNDEIKATQAGKPPKKGRGDDLDTPPPPKGGTEPTRGKFKRPRGGS